MGAVLKRIAAPIVTVTEMVQIADIIVDCAPANAFRSIAGPALAGGRLLPTVSGAALLDAPDLVAVAERRPHYSRHRRAARSRCRGKGADATAAGAGGGANAGWGTQQGGQ